MSLSAVQQRPPRTAAAAAALYRPRFPVYMPHVSAAVLSTSLPGLLIGRLAGPMRESVTQGLDLPATRVRLINSQTLRFAAGWWLRLGGVVFKIEGVTGRCTSLSTMPVVHGCTLCTSTPKRGMRFARAARGETNNRVSTF